MLEGADKPSSVWKCLQNNNITQKKLLWFQILPFCAKWNSVQSALCRAGLVLHFQEQAPTIELAPAKAAGISVRILFNCRDLGISQNVAFAEALVKDSMSPQMK